MCSVDIIFWKFAHVGVTVQLFVTRRLCSCQSWPEEMEPQARQEKLGDPMDSSGTEKDEDFALRTGLTT